MKVFGSGCVIHLVLYMDRAWVLGSGFAGPWLKSRSYALDLIVVSDFSFVVGFMFGLLCFVNLAGLRRWKENVISNVLSMIVFIYIIYKA